MQKLEWTDIDFLCSELAQEIKECGIEFSVIYGKARGGLIPAVMLSHLLSLPLVTNYEDLYHYHISLGKSVLVVDDINDTGETLRIIRTHQTVKTAVLYERAASSIRSDFVGRVLDHNGWLIFPWEIIENAMEEMAEYLDKRHGSVV